MLSSAAGTDFTAVDCSFVDNVGDEGGAVYMAGAALDLIRCSFFGNRASGSDGIGGAISLIENSDLSASACLFSANSSDGPAGAVSLSHSSCDLRNTLLTGNSSQGDGGAFLALESSIEMSLYTVASNWSNGGGGALHLDGVDAVLVQSILWGNCSGSGGGDVHLVSTITLPQLGFTCSALDSARIAGDGTISYTGPQVFSDPLFCNPSSCDAAPTMEGGYSLSAASPYVPENNSCGQLVGGQGGGCN